MTFILDYILAFASIGLMGFAPKLGKLPVTAKVVIGTVIVFAARFIFHLCSGFIFFAEDSVWTDLPQTNMFVYSFIYQCVYLPADCAICVAVLVVLVKTKVFDKLLNVMGRGRKTEEKPEAAQTENGADEVNAEDENRK